MAHTIEFSIAPRIRFIGNLSGDHTASSTRASPPEPKTHPYLYRNREIESGIEGIGSVKAGSLAEAASLAAKTCDDRGQVYLGIIVAR